MDIMEYPTVLLIILNQNQTPTVFGWDSVPKLKFFN